MQGAPEVKLKKLQKQDYLGQGGRKEGGRQTSKAKLDLEASPYPQPLYSSKTEMLELER